MRKIVLVQCHSPRVSDESFLCSITVAGLDGRPVSCHVPVCARREVS